MSKNIAIVFPYNTFVLMTSRGNLLAAPLALTISRADFMRHCEKD